uniref:UPAR/Ly6 domain-containing protein n=1 Tax=Mastacembelus armatus TaxID=205130 RepID=A0A7N8WLN0_9TELE
MFLSPCRQNMLQLLHVAVLWFYLLPSLLCDNLPCYYSPILEKGKIYELVVTECPPDKLCFNADGRYGNHSALSARGCMAKKDCTQSQKIRVKGTVYTMSYACCDWPYCNSCTSITTKYLPIAVTLVTVTVMTLSL